MYACCFAEPSQKYEPHFDYFHDAENVRNGGQRIATMLMYLSDVQEGGETVFPSSPDKPVMQSFNPFSLCTLGPDLFNWLTLRWPNWELCEREWDIEPPLLKRSLMRRSSHALSCVTDARHAAEISGVRNEHAACPYCRGAWHFAIPWCMRCIVMQTRR